MTARLPVAVIGCGHLGTFHARLYAAMPEADLRMVMDIAPQRAQTLGESLGVPWTEDLFAALRGVRAVSIATPTLTHATVARACLEAGCAVLVEKPLCATAAEGAALVAQAERAGLLLAVGHVERFNPAFRAARASIGVPRFIESHRLSTFVPRSLDVDVVLDLMIHDLDLTLGLVGGPIESIDAVGVPVLTSGEDIANARIRFAGGAVANLTASRVSRERVRKIRFFAEGRYVSVDLAGRTVEQVLLEQIPEGVDPAADAGPSILAGQSATGRPSAAGPEELALLAYLGSRRLRLRHGPVVIPEANALEDELRDFLRAVDGARLEGASGVQGLRSLEAALEIHRKAQDSLRRLGLEANRRAP